MLWSLGLVVLCIDIWTRMKSGKGAAGAGGAGGGGGRVLGGNSSSGLFSPSVNDTVRIITNTNHTINEKVLFNVTAILANFGGSGPDTVINFLVDEEELNKLLKQITPPTTTRPPTEHTYHETETHETHHEHFSSSTTTTHATKTNEYEEEQEVDNSYAFSLRPEYDEDGEQDKNLQEKKATEKTASISQFPKDHHQIRP